LSSGPKKYPLKIRVDSAFLDVMIFRDAMGLRERQSDGYPLWSSSVKLLLAICQHAIPKVYTSPLTLLGIAAEAKISFANKTDAEKATMEFVGKFVTPYFTFVDLTNDIITNALANSISELEDRIIFYSALKVGAKCLVTRNVSDLMPLCKNSSIEVLKVEDLTGYPRR
jgi:hypothetical protein